MDILPGGSVSPRPLDVIWIVNCSSSMARDKIQSLNTAIREAIPSLEQAAQSNIYAQVYVRVIKFSSGAQWHIARTPLEFFHWRDVIAGGASDMGKALKMVAEQLQMPPMEQRDLPPVLILITDSYPTDDAEQGIKAIMEQPWGRKATRLAIGIGTDVDYTMLQRFIGNPEIAPLRADNAENLWSFIRWADDDGAVSDSDPYFPYSDTLLPSKEEPTMSMMPGGPVAARPLEFFWIADCSGSMSGSKIQSLNTAIREAIPAMLQAAQSNIYAQVYVRAIKFSSGATWHIATRTPLESFQWQDLSAGGVTDMGKALRMVADQLKMPPMEQRGYPPVLVLITDGYPTDDVGQGIKAIMEQPWGKKAVRLAIGIGADVDYSMLQRFIGNPEIAPLRADNAEDLITFIKWASTAAVQASSAPAVPNDPASSGLGGPVLPTIPAPPPPSSGNQPSGDVW